MFERFTDRSRKVMALANQEAIRRGHSAIDTEHMLLGLLQEGAGIAANVLRPLVGGNLAKVRLEMKKLMSPDGSSLATGKLPQTKQAKAVIMFAIEEAKSLRSNHVGTEHLLLGMLRQADGVAGRALTNLGVKIEITREAVNKRIGPTRAGSTADPTKEPKEALPRGKPWWRFW